MSETIRRSEKEYTKKKRNRVDDSSGVDGTINERKTVHFL